MEVPPVINPQREADWWDRNWKWFVPTLVLSLLVLMAGFFVALFYFVFGLIKGSEPYQMSLELAASSPALIAKIGEPIEPGWLVTGNISYHNASGDADLTIPLEGPKGEATLYIVAKRELGEWTLTRAVVEVHNSGERLKLLE